MARRAFLFILIAWWGAVAFGQQPSSYQSNFDTAIEHYKNKEYEKSIQELQPVLESKNKQDLLRALYIIGCCHYYQNDKAKAAEIWLESLAIDPNYRDSIEMMGIRYANDSDTKTRTELGLKYLSRAEELFSEKRNVYYNLACLYSLRNEIEQAIIRLDKAIYYGFDDFKWMREDADLANLRTTTFFVRLIDNLDNLKIAQEHFDAAEKSAAKLDYAGAIGRYEAAAKYFIMALGENGLDVAFTYNKIGVTYDAKGEFDKALRSHEKALAVYLRILGEIHPYTATCYNNIGTDYSDKGEYDRALSYHEKALAIRIKTSGEHHLDTAACYNNIGSDWADKREYDKAIVYHEKTLAICLRELGENHQLIATSYSHLGGLYNRKGERDKAIAYHEKALAVRMKVLGEDHPDTASTYNNIGAVYSDKGDFEKAIGYFQKALFVKVKVLGENHPDTALLYHNIAFAYGRTGEYNQAVVHYEKALAILKKSEVRQRVIISLENLGALHLRRRNYEKARACFDEAIMIIETARSELGGGKTEFMQRNIKSYLHSLLANAGLNDPAGFLAVSEAMRSRGFLDRLSLSTALGAEGVTEADRRRMIALNDELESLVRRREAELRKDLDRQSRDRLVVLGDAISAREREFSALDEALLKNERYRNLRRPRIAGLADAQKLCADRSAILEYVIWEGGDDNRQSYCIVVTKQGAVIVALDRDFRYSEWVERMRQAVLRSMDEPADPVEPAAALYAALIAPLEKHLAGVDRIVIVPDGPLAFLPFDALRRGPAQPYLCQRFAVTLSPSISVSLMVRSRTHPARDREMIAFGGALYAPGGGGVDRGQLKGKTERGLTITAKEEIARQSPTGQLAGFYDALGYTWDNLPGTLEEVTKIIGQVYGNRGVRLLTGREVTERAVKELSGRAELKKYKVIHFACHGYYEQSYPSFSSIVFSEVSKSAAGPEDGYLNVEEAALLVLESDLVNLSACETGLGRLVQGDGVVGLTRALMVAGSDGVGVTLWTVADDATCRFMVAVYVRAVREKKTYAEAYRETKLEFIQSKDFASPYFWSPFILYQ